VNPLGEIYGAFVGTRNYLFDRGVLRSYKLAGPVVSVGNISVGGSGKTPFVIVLGELLKRRGIGFDVLSRGYGRKTRRVLQVAPEGSAADFGDEPLLIAQRLGCPVIVGGSRYQAGLFAESKFGPQLHILDDGFQHRSLARDFDIVLLTAEDLQDRLLPGGRLREPASSLSRADSVVLMGEMEVPAVVLGKTLWRARRSVEVAGAPDRPLVFCGIARPRKFTEQLREIGIEPRTEKFYRDHNTYTAADIRDLLALRDQTHAGGFITTEKDAINLGPNLAKLGSLAIARVHLELLSPADALDTMLRTIAERKGSA
jgi:tetraacyldisaccharide 4'-kinase